MEEEFRKIEQDNRWSDHFSKLMTKSRKHSHDIGESSQNLPLNRYLNVLPYDRSRIKLVRCADETDYINANLVSVPKAARQYILTQGPLPETLPHFWLMIWEQKSRVIVMLNKCVELGDIVKCEQYWPDKPKSNLEFEDQGLEVILEKVEIKKHFTIRHLMLKDIKSGESRDITQFQYTAWPDHDQPDSPTSFLRLLTAIRKSGGLDNIMEPTIVHCSAGIGRSGTFCLIDSILSMVENQGSAEGIDIANTLLEMRDCRMGLIQSPVQLRFAYMSIIYGIKILERANKLHPHMSSMTKVNGSSNIQQTNGKSQRRTKKKQGNNILNVFNQHQLVEALDEIDSDAADEVFEDTMKHLPSLKKARSTDPSDFMNDGDFMAQLYKFMRDSPQNKDDVNPLEANLIDLILAGNKIVCKDDLQSTAPQVTDSEILKRRERELKKQRLAERTQEMVKKSRAAEQRKERMEFFKKSAIVGCLAILAGSIYAYVYISN